MRLILIQLQKPAILATVLRLTLFVSTAWWGKEFDINLELDVFVLCKRHLVNTVPTLNYFGHTILWNPYGVLSSIL